MKPQGDVRTRRSLKQWLKKYFWEGQLQKSEKVMRTPSQEGVSPQQPWLTRHRRLVAVTTPLLLAHALWWTAMARHSLWSYFREAWFMSATMVFGSIVAGMTSEGGGAVAFPVMTLAFKIPPSVARDFSMLIQACGMSAASATILLMRIRVEQHALVLSSLGGAAGVILGLELVDPLLSPPQKKMGFVSVWSSFAIVLFILNRTHKRITFEKIVSFSAWKGVVLFGAGVLGGICTSFSGSGLDICTFSFLTVLFRVSEKVATPTSVILMAGNSLVGVYWRSVMMEGLAPAAWRYMLVCAPIVVIGAPLGSLIGSHFHRLVLAALVYVLDLVALISAFFIVPQTPALIVLSVSTIVTGFLFFFVLSLIGNRLLEQHNSVTLREGGIESKEDHTSPIYKIESGLCDSKGEEALLEAM